MIENFELKEDLDFESEIGIKNNDVIRNEVQDVLAWKYKSGDKVGNTWEIIDAHLTLNPYQPYLNIFNRPFKKDYLEKEHKWYMSQDLSIKGWMDDIKIWNFCASKDDKQLINSNYGWCVFSKENGDQYENCLKKMKEDVNTREALMIYTRPSMHNDAVENGKHDFMCTVSAQAMIRNGKLYYIVTQRSCDLVTGLSFDFPWHCFVYQMMYEELKQTYPELERGSIFYNIGSLHVYDRHENLLKAYSVYG